MARAGRKDRGLLVKKDSTGGTAWYVRLYHEGRARQFGSFKTKTQAREFYEKAKSEQKIGRFFPERYQLGRCALIEELLLHNAETTTVKNKATEKYYMTWWGNRLKGLRLNRVTPAVIEEAQRFLLAQRYAPQTVVHYLKALRHVLNKAVRDGKLDRNPFSQVRMVKVRNGKTRFLTTEEEMRLFEHLGPNYGPVHAVTIQIGSDYSGPKYSGIEVTLIEGCDELLRWIDEWAQDVPIHLLNLPPSKNSLSFII